MKHITFYLDFVSPYAWLAMAQMPQALQGISHHIEYRPVLLGALLQQDANPGPAGIPAKRLWTYRHVCWLAQSQGTPLQMPAQHPFRPTPLLRLALAHGSQGRINRYVAQTVMEHVWQGGQDANDEQRLAQLRAQLAPQKQADESSDDVKQWLRSNTEMARRDGVFGVPAWVVDGKVFWGQDALPMLRSYLQGHAWFEAQWHASDALANGLAASSGMEQKPQA